MTLDEAMREARRMLDERIAEALAESERMLARFGATAAEIEAELAMQRGQLVAQRDVHLAKIEREMRGLPEATAIN